VRVIATADMGRSTIERAILSLLVLTAFLIGVSTATGTVPGNNAAPVQRTAAATTLSSSIPPGALDVAPSEPLVITAANGTLGDVTASGPGGAPLGGQFNHDRTRWTSNPLAYGTAYTTAATGRSADGSEIPALQSSFSTLKPARTLAVESIRPSNGDVVGIAMPVTINFDAPVKDRAAVQQRLAVIASVPTPGAFHWMSDQQVNWRPKEYWKAGTVVVVKAALNGVNTGGGTYGAKDSVTTFSIGKAQSVIGDVNTFQLTMYVDGKPVQSLPASFGRAIYPTQYGVHVAYEKTPLQRMRSDTWAGGPKVGDPGFYDVDVPFAVRISANGEFVHVNGATVEQQGRANVSHGCINLSPANGKLFYDWVQFGDPVEIVGSSRPLTPGDGPISDWTIPWDEYVKGSALPVTT
jgi:lipoprotein-anchoring transpeptidase ErfK/SrfK